MTGIVSEVTTYNSYIVVTAVSTAEIEAAPVVRTLFALAAVVRGAVPMTQPTSIAATAI